MSSFKNEGFVVRRRLFEPGEISAALEEARDAFRRQLRHRGIGGELEPGMERLFREHREAFLGTGKLCQHLVSLHRLSLDGRVLGTLRELGLGAPTICTRPVMFFSAAGLASADVYYRTPPHQDWRTMRGSRDAVVAWLPLAPVPPELGPLEVVPGSHRDGLYPATPAGWGFSAIDRFGEKDFVPLNLDPGDVAFFSAFLVHRSGDNRAGRVRWSAHFRYNNAEDPDFIARGYPCPYRYESVPPPGEET